MNLRRRVEGIIYNDKKEIIIGIHVNSWFLPGGGVRKNELDSNALIRECKEEIFTNISNIKLISGTPYIHDYNIHGYPDMDYPNHFDHKGERYTGEKTWFYIAKVDSFIKQDIDRKHTYHLNKESFINLVFGNVRDDNSGYFYHLFNLLKSNYFFGRI